MLHWVSSWIKAPGHPTTIADIPSDDSLVAQDVDEDWILFGEQPVPSATSSIDIPVVATQTARKISRQERRLAQRIAAKKARANHDAPHDLLLKLKDRELKERKLRKLSYRGQAPGGGMSRAMHSGAMGIMRPGGGSLGVIA